MTLFCSLQLVSANLYATVYEPIGTSVRFARSLVTSATPTSGVNRQPDTSTTTRGAGRAVVLLYTSRVFLLCAVSADALTAIWRTSWQNLCGKDRAPIHATEFELFVTRMEFLGERFYPVFHTRVWSSCEQFSIHGIASCFYALFYQTIRVIAYSMK